MKKAFVSSAQRKAVMARMRKQRIDYAYKRYVGVAPIDTKSKLIKRRKIGNRLDWEKDKTRKAYHAGKRTSEDGSRYYEYRANRSDISRSERL